MSARAFAIPLLLATSLVAPRLDAQSSMTAEDLAFYRVQAFTAGPAERRLPLNHIGIAGHVEADGFRVTAVLDDYPAHRAGILRGDLLLTAAGEPYHPIAAFNPDELTAERLTPRPHAVDIALLRHDSRLTVTVTPVFENLYDSYRSASLASVQRFPSGNKTVGYVRLWALSRATADLLAYRRLFEELAGSDGIILDLRDATGYFSLQQLDLVYRGRAELLSSSAPPHWPTGMAEPGWPLAMEPYRNPVVILINGATEAGAELLAYQLGKRPRVTVVGSNSAGRLGNYRRSDTAAGAAFTYEPASGVLFDGVEREGVGFAPEREAPYPEAQQGRIDPQFQIAFDILMGVI
ncbi:MAG: S41 family peptidase [Pseudohongiellaceae bacterium]